MEIVGEASGLLSYNFRKNGAFSISDGGPISKNAPSSGPYWSEQTKIKLQASNSWEGSTSNASPITSISKTGGGKAFDILPPYYTCHMWIRLT